MGPERLSVEDFRRIVRDAPLVAMDVIVDDGGGRVLVGWRSNAPARGCWFVPGGRIRKGERLADAFRRITRDELGCEVPLDEARALGAFEHLYDENPFGEEGFGTHYVVLGYALRRAPDALALPTGQHARYRWMTAEELLVDPDVHANTRAYVGPWARAHGGELP